MNVRFTVRQAVLTPEIKAYCERRLAGLQGLAGDGVEINVILGIQKNRSRAEIHVTARGVDLVVEEEMPDLMNALTLAFDNLEKKVKKEREKWRERKRRGGRERKGPAPSEEEAGENKRVVRSSHYSLKPMSLEEALVQLDVKNREVFMFRREDCEKWAVVYKRKDGHCGLVEPD